MDATLYTGNGSARSITNAAPFKPDFVWIKSRTNAGFNHDLFDSVRGVGNTLFSDTTGAEEYSAQRVTAFNSNGFSLGTADGVNYSGSSFVGWQWQAGQGTTSSNTSGSITSTVSVNPTAGFSVVTYTGNKTATQTVGHGLGVAPSMIILKSRSDGALNWYVYHSALGYTYRTFLNLTNAASNTSSSTVWATAPTSTVFGIGDSDGVNASGGTYVAYCWSEIAGFSKFGSYTGNGSTDGPFIYTGFRPKFWMVKNTTTAGNSWVMVDTSRSPYNVANLLLLADTSGSEVTTNTFDILSNGIKLRSTDGSRNANGDNYIYMAFAEYPFKSALAR
jgi:hypothetical protein